MTAEVIDLPVITTLDLDPKRVLSKALDAELESVLVIGHTKDGDFYFAGSMANGPENLWLLEVAKKELLAVGHPIDDD